MQVRGIDRNLARRAKVDSPMGPSLACGCAHRVNTGKPLWDQGFASYAISSIDLGPTTSSPALTVEKASHNKGTNDFEPAFVTLVRKVTGGNRYWWQHV